MRLLRYPEGKVLEGSQDGRGGDVSALWRGRVPALWDA
jgi:hypothetical protein